MATEQQRTELIILWEKYADGTTSEEEVQRLETLAKSDPELMRLFVNIAHQHACLAMNPDVAAPFSFNDNMKALIDNDGGNGLAEPIPAGNVMLFSGSRLNIFLRIAALLITGLGIGYVLACSFTPINTAGGKTIATLSETVQCQWAGGTLPTEQGANLLHGRLRLTSGLATVTFTSGARVVMEGPVDMELISPMKCKLYSGLVVAHVPKQAINFEIETPKAKVFDLGTEFALSVNPQGNTQVRVINGLIEAQPNQSRTRHLVKCGEAAVIETEMDFRLDKTTDNEIAHLITPASEPLSDAMVRISTADGNGQDAYVSNAKVRNHDSNTLLLIKNGRTCNGYHRKVYLSFDLSRIGKAQVERALLRLVMEPSGFGAASGLSDAVFKVYGITDENIESWTADMLNWGNAPANMPDGNEVDPATTVYLGSFTRPRGIQHGYCELTCDELTKFLNSDTNGSVTLIIVRETRENPSGDLVHAFASRRHPGAQPPTLQLKLEDK
ncbi:MAG: hypothetical protein A2283_16605 [Lentisphaerae bacterium RIFOXYA12_FULL_48_11]|nr:MAG: hypothetical protein A2283_16605 [Lentisphaerae bacterium RIFOXYA12_FULL_48_11]